MTIALVSWLPLIDLPLPLVILGGVMLAIASNREQPLANSGSHSTQAPVSMGESPNASSVDAELSGAGHANIHGDSVHQAQRKSASATILGNSLQNSSKTASPPHGTAKSLDGVSLPMVKENNRPISPVISRPESKYVQTEPKRTPGSTTAGRSPKSVADPQLPVIGTKNLSRKDVSFTIHKQDED